MKYQSIILFLSLSFISVFSSAQTALKGKITDQGDGSPIIFANVELLKDSIPCAINISDFDGVYQLDNLKEGVYSLKVSYLGYKTQVLDNIVVKANILNTADLQMKPSEVELETIEVVSYCVPLIQQDNTTQGAVITSQNIRNLPTRNINALAGKTAGISVTNGSNKKIQIRGSRTKDITNDTEHYDAITENVFKPVQAEPVSTFSIDVDAASYSNLRRFLNNGDLPPANAVRIEEMINYFDYDYPTPMNGQPFEVITEYGDCPWAQEHKLLHIGLQGMTISNDNLPASNLVFLIDVSGSMSAYNKLPLLKESFKLLVNQLRRNDRVSIVVYAGAAGQVLAPTSGSNKQAILDALRHLQAGGSTAGGAGIQLAYKLAREQFIEGGNNRVVLATDGDFNVGIRDDNKLVELIEKERQSGVFLSILGFGTGNYKDSKMQKLANKGNGNHAYIDNIKEAKKVLVNEFGGTLFTIAKDVKIQLEFNPQKVAGYRLIGYENRLLNREDFDDDTKDAGELGAGHTVTALYEIIPAGVESDFLAASEDLKYQEVKPKKSKASETELVNIKLRYKPKNRKKSKLLSTIVEATATDLDRTSDNFRWSAAVAQFGMLLRASKFKGTATYEQTEALANQSKGKDEHAYRAEMIALIQQAKTLSIPLEIEKE